MDLFYADVEYSLIKVVEVGVQDHSGFKPDDVQLFTSDIVVVDVLPSGPEAGGQSSFQSRSVQDFQLLHDSAPDDASVIQAFTQPSEVETVSSPQDVRQPATSTPVPEEHAAPGSLRFHHRWL